MTEANSSEKRGFFTVINHEFTWFITGRMLFIGGLRMTPVLLGWKLYEITGSKLALGILGLSEVIPAILLALPAGVKDGINYEADNTAATLVLYAPSKNRVSVIGDLTGSNWAEQLPYQMNKTPDGNYWWIRLTGLTPGTEYSFQYLVDGTLKIAEPYAEKILDPWNDPFIPSTTYPGLKPYPANLTSGIVSVLQTNQSTYNWQSNSYTRPDKRKLVIYELLLRDFLANHDWATLNDTLNYLKNMGITAIQLMPINEFEGYLSWGYNPDFYFAPDKY